MISRSELSARTGVHQATLRRWEAAGVLVPVRDGRRVLYPPEAVAKVKRLKARGPVTAWNAKPRPVPDAATLPEYLTIAQAAAVLGCSLATIHRLKRRGALATYEGEPGTRIVRVSRDEVIALLRVRKR